MALEDNFLRLDPNNYDDEIKHRLDMGYISRQDILQFFCEKYISYDQFKDYWEYAGRS